MIIISIASVNNPSRLKSLELSLSRLLAQDTPLYQIVIYLEGYREIPDILGKNFPNADFILAPVTGGLSSYKVFDNYENCIFVSLDDDLILPNNFISQATSSLNFAGKSAAITYLSKHYPAMDPPISYEDFESIYFSHSCNNFYPCHILGSGISLFYSSYMKGCYKFISEYPIPGIYRDMLVSFYLWMKGITILRAPSNTNWITGRNIQPNCNDAKPLIDRNKYFSLLLDEGFLQKKYFGSLK